MVILDATDIPHKLFRHARFFGGGGGSPPPPPDYEKQAGANIETAIAQGVLNRPRKVITPFGTTTNAEIGQRVVGNHAVPVYDQTQELTPKGQEAVDTLQDATADVFRVGRDQVGRIGSALSQPFDVGSASQIPGTGDLFDDRNFYANSVFNRHASRLNPRFSQGRSDLEAQLRNQGITRDTAPEAYDREWQNFARAENDAYENAANMAIATSGDEMSRQFGLGQARHQQDIQDMLYNRAQPLNEFNALMSSGQVNVPQVNPLSAVGIAPTNILGAQMEYNNQVQNANQLNAQSRNAGIGSALSMLGTIGGGILAASSKTYKNRIGSASAFLDRVKTLDVHTWEYKPEMGLGTDAHVGPYAEDWAERFGGDGKTINMIDGLGVCIQCIKELINRIEVLEGSYVETHEWDGV